VERGQRDRRLADEINRYSDNPISAFDFPLRYRLKDACDTHGYSLRRLAEVADRDGERPDRAVTFVDNHDFRAATPARSSTTS
jgi:alpha-amylase